jgi:hypothetical protein
MFDRNKRCSLTITLDFSSQKVMQYCVRKFFSLAGEMQLKSEFKYTIAFIEQRIYCSQLSYQTILYVSSEHTVQWQNLKTHARTRFL